MTDVVHVVDMQPNKQGPVEIQLLELSRLLAASGLTMACVFSGEPPAWYADAMGNAGCSIAVISGIDTRSGKSAVLRYIESEHPSVVHLHFVRPHLFSRSVRSIGVPGIVRTEHTYLQCGSRVRRYMRRWRIRGVDITIACARHIAEQTKREYLLADSRVRVVRNGVDLNLFRPRPNFRYELRQKWINFGAEAIVVTVAANFIPRKRIELAIEAFAIVRRSAENLRLVLAGNGPSLSVYQDLIHQHKLAADVVILTGDNVINEVYAASDIAVLTSWGEGLPGAGMEALACGLPMVATNTPGLDETVEHGVTGLLVDSNPDSIANGILMIAGDSDLRARMSKSARCHAEAEFDVRRAARETAAIYAQWIPRWHA